MGYSTSFRGTLKFTSELSEAQLNLLDKIIGADTRDHPEWAHHKTNSYFYYIDLELNKSRTGLKWSGDEKTGAMDGIVQYVLNIMREQFPEFGLKGTMLAQGEEAGDVYKVIVDEEGIRIQDIEVDFEDDD